MLFEHRKLVCESGGITKHVTGIAVLRHELEGDLLAVTTNHQGDMGKLHPFGLIDCTMHLIIRPFKGSLLLRPYGNQDLDCFA